MGRKLIALRDNQFEFMKGNSFQYEAVVSVFKTKSSLIIQTFSMDLFLLHRLTLAFLAQVVVQWAED